MLTQSVVERYYDQYFFTTDGGEDQYVNQHFNGMCVVGIAPGHPLLREKKVISSMYFGMAKLRNKVAGKSKKGGMWVDTETTLCVIGATNCQFVPKCGIKGELLEVNGEVMDKPLLITNHAQTEGYLAIIAPRRGQEHLITRDLIPFDEYYDDRPYLIKPKRISDDILDSDFGDLGFDIELNSEKNGHQ